MLLFRALPVLCLTARHVGVCALGLGVEERGCTEKPKPPDSSTGIGVGAVMRRALPCVCALELVEPTVRTVDLYSCGAGLSSPDEAWLVHGADGMAAGAFCMTDAGA